MDWVNIAVLNAAVMGVVLIIDSHLLFKRMPSLKAYLLPAGIVALMYSFLLCPLFPLPGDVSIMPLMAALVAGVLRPTCGIIVLHCLRMEDVSQVASLVFTYPIFVALIAMPFLGEYLRPLEWLALVIVVAGAIIVSIKKSPSGSTILNPKLLLLLGASLLLAVSDIASKYALASISFWNLFWICSFCMAGIFIGFSINPHAIKQLMSLENKTRVLGLLTFNQILVLVGTVLAFWALQKGPVSLVSTIISSRPMFVLIFTIILSLVWPSFLEVRFSKKMAALRLVATAMIVGGIAIIQILH